MTSQQVELRKLKEQQRTNRRQEEIKSADVRERQRSNRVQEQLGAEKNRLTKRGQNIDIGSRAVDTTMKVASLVSKNDKAWYDKNKQWTESSANISYQQAIGTVSKNLAQYQGAVESYSEPSKYGEEAYPGVCAICWVPTMGTTKNGILSTATLAAQKVYAEIRRKNSGAKNYEPSDVMKYILAIDSLYSAIAYGMRIVSLLNTGKIHNKYYPRGHFTALGLDYSSFEGRTAEIVSFINEKIIALNSYPVPNDWPFILRHIWMNLGIFKDTDIHKSQEYLYNQTHFYQYQRATDSLKLINPGGTALDGIGSPTVVTYTQWKTLVSTSLEALNSSSDVGIIAGDIIQAFGENNLFTFDQITTDFHVEAVHNMEILSQIGGTTLCGRLVSGWNITSITDPDDENYGALVYQSDAGVNYDPTFRVSGLGNIPSSVSFSNTNLPKICEVALVNMYKDKPEPVETIVATRMTTTGKLDQSTTAGINYTLDSFGTEIATVASVVEYQRATPSLSVGFKRVIYTSLMWMGELFSNTQAGVFNNLLSGMIFNYDWHPQVRMLVGGNATIDTVAYGTYAAVYLDDVCNATVIDSDTLENLHRVAAYSEFNITDLD